MNLLDTVLFAISNLWRRKLRTFLTVLGVIIGTACIIIMVALGLGSLEQFNETVMQSEDLTRIQVYTGGYGDSAVKLNEAALDDIKAIPGVKSATGLLDIPSFMVMGRYECSWNVYGVDPEAMGFEFMEGEVFSNTSEVELVLGAGTRQYFADPHDSSGWGDMYYSSYAIGYGEEEEYVEPTGPDVDWLEQQITYYPSWSAPGDENVEYTPDNPAPKQYRAKVSGILEQSNDSNSYSMFMSQKAARQLIRENRKLMENMGVKEDVYSQAYVNAVDVEAVEEILPLIKEKGFQVYSPTEWITQMQSEYARQQALLLAIAMISLLVSAIGIANTMLASILERRREIGVMKVIGLSVGKINLMFLVEAALIGLVGGLIAMVASYILAAVVNMGAVQSEAISMFFMGGGIRVSIPWWLALGALGISTGVGVVSGLYPAWKATRMSPLEAIRSGI